eukprot:9795252-Lingulodinium_polyedra.AAC.2
MATISLWVGTPVTVSTTKTRQWRCNNCRKPTSPSATWQEPHSQTCLAGSIQTSPEILNNPPKNDQTPQEIETPPQRLAPTDREDSDP